MSETKKLMPELRFPGFEGAWEEKRLGDVLSIGSGRDYKHLGDGDIPVFGTGGYMASVDEYLYDGETVCIGRKGTINAPMYFKGKLWTVDTLFFTHKFQDILVRFIYCLFLRINWLKHNEASGVPSLSKKTIEQLICYIPPFSEQQKIADFLTAIDDKITQLSDKKHALVRYKKGLMQKLFPKAGQKVPELRFPGFSGEWEEKRLGDVLTIGSGRDYKHLKNGDVPVFGTGGYMAAVDDYLYDGETVCIGRKGTIDKPMFFSGKIWTVDTLFFTHQFINVFVRFIYYIFLKINWLQHNEASGVPSLSKKTIERLMVPLPPLPEQQKIADFLTTIDDKIDLTEQHIQQAQTFKKGLMQQLFV